MTKLSNDEILAAFKALPTKEHYEAMRNAQEQLGKIYSDFAIKHLGYKSAEEVVSDGVFAICDIQYAVKELVEDLPDYQKMEEAILFKFDEQDIDYTR